MPSRADYAKIHIACKELGIDDESYRAILGWKFKVDSAKELTASQVAELLDHFRTKGWRPKKPTAVKDGRRGKKKVSDNYRRIEPGPASQQQKYILALWALLGYEVKKLDSRCHKQFGIDRIEWVTRHSQLHILITDLRQRCAAAGIELEE